MDTRTPEEISIAELQLASCAPIDHVTKLVTKLARRLELSKRKRRNSETSEISVLRYDHQNPNKYFLENRYENVYTPARIKGRATDFRAGLEGREQDGREFFGVF